MSIYQAMFYSFKREMQAARAVTQMTLGKLIDRLKSLPQDLMISGLGDLSSYRGYYEDLAFEPLDVEIPVSELLNECMGAMGRTYYGYKGGEYLMGENTPLWIAEYGCCGVRLMGITDKGEIVTAVEEQ